MLTQVVDCLPIKDKPKDSIPTEATQQDLASKTPEAFNPSTPEADLL